MKYPLLLVLLVAPALLAAQDVPYRLGRWDPDSLGNHRAVVRVARPAKAVQVTIPWRRRDAEPEQNQIMVTTASGLRVGNAVPIDVTQERGILAFEPSAGAGEYYVYFMPYRGSVRSNYPQITYRAADSTANPRWLTQQKLTRNDIAAGRWRALPAATVVAIEAVDSMSNRWPMEVIATEAELTALRRGLGDAPFALFAEDRTRPIIMTNELPQSWAAPGVAGRAIAGEALKGEFYPFQIGVWALRRLDSLQLSFTDLAGPGGAIIPASAFTSFNTGGIDWRGRPFARWVGVGQLKVQALWAGVMLPEEVTAGEWQGTATVTAAGGLTRSIPVRLTVKDSVIADHGDDDPWRLSRLRWLNSALGLDSSVIPPYTPVKVTGTKLEILGRSVELGAGGLPTQFTSTFTSAMTAANGRPRRLLRAPIRFEVLGADSVPLTWTAAPVTMTHTLPGIAAWESELKSGAVTASVRGSLEFDGTIEYQVALTASETTAISNAALLLPLHHDVAKYWMGLGRQGGAAPDSFDWRWDVRRNQDAAWVGDVNAGVQVTLFDDKYDRPLNTNFYQLKPLVMPRSWENGGAGGCSARRKVALLEYQLRCAGGARTLVPGDTLWFNFRLLLTPFHPIDPEAQFRDRFFHAYKPIPEIQGAGANVVNVHHATAINPYINYPFFRPREMRAYADSAHEVGIKFKIYYTVRELTNRAPEFWALRSFGHEVFAGGPGGGHSWLQEHVGTDYITGWVVPELRDIALVTSGISRWHNHYVEGLQWLVAHEQIDGLYLDDVAFDRSTMQRMRRVLARGRPAPMIDLHSANQFNPADGFASSANLYLEHFPYIDRLWFGEYFKYDSTGADYWLVELSGIPFGLMGEMLQDGGNPWRGMVFGMTARLPWAGDPRPLWRVWDEFGLASARMHGWWDPLSPVKTQRGDVLATTYVRDGKTLIALASWATDTVDVRLRIDWRALGINAAHASIWAPAIDRMQEARTFQPGGTIPVAPGRGWLLVVE